ncbi:MAG: hypothetical protein AABW72_04830 [archaeon]
MEKRFVYGILAIIVVIAAVYVLWNLPKGQTADKKGFAALANSANNILASNEVAFETVSESKLAVLSEEKVETAKADLLDLQAKNADNKALADLVDLYVALLDELKVQSKLKKGEETLLKLSSKGLCENLNLLDNTIQDNENAYNLVLENNKKLEEYVVAHPTENQELGLENYLEDEDEAFINYYELKDYIVTIEENCLAIGEGLPNEE